MGARVRRALKTLFWTTMLLVSLGGVGAIVGYRWLDSTILSDLPEDLSSYRQWRPLTTCTVFAADGSQIDEFYVERRVWVPLAELQDTTWQAFLAAEDRRFFQHKGVDPRGIARAFWSNLHAGAVRQGGSTITQQLVKNLLVGNERSYERKIKEAVLAARLERELSKEQILELFINYVFLGSGNYGIEAAARDYFGVSARELDPGQAAMLAGLIPAPSNYNPRRSPEQAIKRRSVVLQAMVAEGYIPALDATSYELDPVLVPGRPKATAGDASYITMVRREVRRLLPGNIPFETGLRVYTAFDPALQAVAEQSVRDALVEVDKRQGRRGALRHLEPPQWANFLHRAPQLEVDPATNAVLPPVPGDCFEALVPADKDLGKLSAGPFQFAMREEDRAALLRPTEEDKSPAPLSTVARAGDVLAVCLDDASTVSLDPRPWPEGAAVVLENRTGRLLAMVGGYRVGIEGFVRATQARRQPGSSFKPYVYGAALLHGRSSLDRVLDAPLSLPAGGGKVWSPKNYDGGYAGLLPMRTAFAKSLNTVAVRLAMDVGADEIARVARAMGVRSPLRADLTLALGSSEISPLDQALGYATIARMGQPTEPVYITRLTDDRDVLLGEAGGPILIRGVAVGALPGRVLPRALPAGVAYELADMLREVVRAGTARKATKAGFDRAGKTGTTNDFMDAWFVGFTPRYTIAVWVGSDTTHSLGDKETGGKTALPAWMRIAEALDDVEGERFMMPDEAMLVNYGGQWVGLGRGRAPAGALPLRAVDPRAPLAAFPTP